MKNLNHILSSMKRITSEGGYATSSRERILATTKTRRVVAGMTLSMFFRGAGVAAMASLAFVGGISVVRMAFPSTAQVAKQDSVNRQTLAAEAETVDTQLALADVQHQAVADSEGKTISPAATRVAKSAAGASSDSSVDRALDALAE